MAVKHLIFYSR